MRGSAGFMQNIYFGPDERAHQKFLDIFYVICGLLCLALAILSLFPAGADMRFFPLIFFIAAILNLVSAYSRFRSSDTRYRSSASGLFLALMGAAMLVLTYVSGICIWG